MKSQTLRPHQTALLIAALASVAFWAIPGIQWVLMPLRYLNTHIHEICHAFATMGTGGSVSRIEVYGTGGGVTLVQGGWTVMLASAGYLGASLVGMGIVMGSRTEKGARAVLRVMAILMGLAMVWWLRSDGIGIASGVFWLAALLGIAAWAKNLTLMFLAQFLGIQQCLNSVESVYTLLKISVASNTHSDAQIMQSATGVPALFWALLWCGFSLTVLTLGLRKAWSTRPTPVPSSRVG